VSLVDLKFVAKRSTTPQEINDALIAAANGKLKGVLTFTHHPLVSSDLNHDPHSATILLDQTKVIDGNFVNIMGWYDNEWGFSNRMVDVTKAFAAFL
jgi:glyceraldehyde 3-phosphate dehydrogenase